jgi:alcohol dehydrogenase
MKSWKVGRGGELRLEEVPEPEPPSGGVVVEMHAAPVLSYLGRVLRGELGYALPPFPFTPGTNGVGVVRRVGAHVYHLAPGDRVVVDPFLVVDERVREPAQILIGLTAMGAARFDAIPPSTLQLQRDYRDGTFAEQALLPASVVTPVPSALERVPAARLAGISKFAVPFGGLLRAGLAAGESLIVNGAAGYFGSAAVLLGVALGASRIVAVGRDRKALEEVRRVAGPRVAAVALSGDTGADAAAIGEAAGGSADVAINLVGQATDASSTLACLHALRRGGRLVSMGSMSVPLPLQLGELLANDWHVMGCFMYPPEAPARLAALVAAGQLDLEPLRVQSFALHELERALAAAAAMVGLDVTALEPAKAA